MQTPTDTTALDIALYLAREAHAALYVATFDGTGGEDAAAAAWAVVEGLQLAAERAAFVAVPSSYATNYR